MKVFKFGGASVKDAEGVMNVARVLKNQGFEQCMLIVSAMGKTTNALEVVVENYFAKKDYKAETAKIKQNHIDTAKGLFKEDHKIYEEIEEFFYDIESFLRRNKSPNYSFVYDQVVSCGEMISSKILSEYLVQEKLANTWLDARDYIKTDASYREGNVDWKLTEENFKKLNSSESFVTQGFIGSDDNNFTVTLGREGSDYSAAIFAYCLNAEQMTIWKDVPGVMTGDPRKFEDVELLDNISYEEAIEMAYYGASVIHPKTLQPLKQKSIPFFVKSFVEDDKPGTKVSEDENYPRKESYILKENQTLMTIATRDFSFIAEDHMSYIFAELAKFKIKVSLIQNTAISLALCLEDKFKNSEKLNVTLNEKFDTSLITDVALFTIRNANMNDAEKFYKDKNVLMEQLAANTLQMVTK
ncbi:aspartate kinase [Elizabethkingia ursingii]|uniref:Aspartokinase n=1 Tax=Elizabethkingia ursingii TaxID=1756150 RepID=A0AAJ3NAQ2_9FLAO|nr:aspartate kinase [Elizabethkingia ursingii]AQX08055.1 aspartate kinase [Elizabethkingia ursingii]OPB73591.1 aspartate kinase [Elizabethkingia ursingii]OPB87126.1 aspartate kinase [Elizabethkingia ursingii]